MLAARALPGVACASMTVVLKAAKPAGAAEGKKEEEEILNCL